MIKAIWDDFERAIADFGDWAMALYGFIVDSWKIASANRLRDKEMGEFIKIPSLKCYRCGRDVGFFFRRCSILIMNESGTQATRMCWDCYTRKDGEADNGD